MGPRKLLFSERESENDIPFIYSLLVVHSLVHNKNFNIIFYTCLKYVSIICVLHSSVLISLNILMIAFARNISLFTFMSSLFSLGLFFFDERKYLVLVFLSLTYLVRFLSIRALYMVLLLLVSNSEESP